MDLKNIKILEFENLLNTKYLQQKNLFLSEIENKGKNIKEIKKENNNIKDNYEKINNKKNKIKDENIQKYIKFYNYNCDVISSKIKLLKNTLK